MMKSVIILLAVMILLGCTTKAGMQVDAGATSFSSGGRVLFS